MLLFTCLMLCFWFPFVHLSNNEHDFWIIKLPYSDNTSDLANMKPHIDRAWCDFWTFFKKNDQLVGGESGANRDLYLFVVLTSLLQSRLEMPKHLLKLEPLGQYLITHQLLPVNATVGDLHDLLNMYRDLFGQFVLNPSRQFDYEWIPIPPELRPMFATLKPTKDSVRMYGDVIDHLLQAYIHFHQNGLKDDEWNRYQRKAELLVTIMPRYSKIIHFITSRKGGHATIAFEFGPSGEFVKEIVGSKPNLLAMNFVPELNQTTSVNLSNSFRKRKRRIMCEHSRHYKFNQFNQNSSEVGLLPYIIGWISITCLIVAFIGGSIYFWLGKCRVYKNAGQISVQ